MWRALEWFAMENPPGIHARRFMKNTAMTPFSRRKKHTGRGFWLYFVLCYFSIFCIAFSAFLWSSESC